MKASYVWLAISALLVKASSAHSSEPFYDMNRTLILDGVLRAVDWSGAQLRVDFHSNDGYDTAEWVVIGPAPAQLLGRGWNKNDLKSGERLDAVIHPDKAGGRWGALIRFYLEDGRTLETGPYGTTQIIPREALELRFANPADDPMGGYYGNTQLILADNPTGRPEANYNGHTYYNADHTMMVASNDLQPDHTWREHILTGVWWLEKQQDKWTRCMLFTQADRPFCHSPVNFEKVGDKWVAILRGRSSDWVEHRELQAGRH